MNRLEEFEAWLEGQRQRLIDPLTRMDELLIYLIKTEARVEELLRQLTGETTIVIEPQVTQLSVSIPVSPQGITEIVKHAGIRGRVWYPCFNLSWACPAGVVTTMPFGIPEGWVATDREKTIYSDFYDPTILVDVVALGQTVTFPGGTTLACPLDIYFGEYWEKHEGEIVYFIVNNTTATDAVVTLSGHSEFLEKSFFEEFYSPLIKKLYESLEALL